jgi:hypothetical protein
MCEIATQELSRTPMILRSMSETTRVSVDSQRISVERLVLHDPSLAAFVNETPQADRAALVERALRIGLLAVCNANATLNVDVVKAEFGRLVTDMAAKQAEAARALETTLRQNFADGDGRLPRQLEAYLGDSGKLNRLVGDLFDERRRDSALGRLRELLGRYFDGDSSQLATLLDPTRQGSPLYQFRVEMTGEFRRLNERLEALEAGAKARAEERARSTAKGRDFEDVLEDALATLSHGSGDLLERTGSEAGDAVRSKKGDFVLVLDPRLTRGLELRLVIEAKNRPIPRQRFMTELNEAKINRRAVVAVAVFAPEFAPAGIAPLQLVGNDVWCVLDPEGDDTTALEAAVRLARVLALTTLREAPMQLDVHEVQDALRDITAEIQRVQSMKTKLSSIGTVAQEVSAALDEMRAGVNRHLRRVEDQLRAVEPDEPNALSA